MTDAPTYQICIHDADTGRPTGTTITLRAGTTGLEAIARMDEENRRIRAETLPTRPYPTRIARLHQLA